MAQENTHNQKMAELAKHKDGHIAYWKAQNKQTDPNRFEDGFIQGWCDAENKDYPNINRDSMVSQRMNEDIARCGNSPNEWAFEHGYHEGFDSRRCLNTGAPKPVPPSQENTHDQKKAEMCKHKDGHIAYWKAHGNKPTNPKRFEDGFIQGWSDCEHNLSDRNITVNSLVGQRHQEHVKSHGNSSCEWAFDDGYREGFESRKCMISKPAPVENTHEQKMAEMCKHKDGHIAYWKAHGNRPTDPERFEDGFIQGWCDCEHHLSEQDITVDSLLGQRHQEHVMSHGDSPCEWAFDDGYREGFEGRRCMKPPQQPAPPVAKSEPPKVTDCPPTEVPKSPPVAPTIVPPTTYPVQPPPLTQPPAPTKPAGCPQQQVTYVPPTVLPVAPAPPHMTNTLGPDHQCIPACNHLPVTTAIPTVSPPTDHHCTSECSTKGCTHSKDGPPSTSKSRPTPAKPAMTDNRRHADEADLPADHYCTSECNCAKKKEGLLQKIEHALRID